MSTSEKPKKKLSFIEKNVANLIIDTVLKKILPGINKDAAELYKANKTVVLTIQDNGQGELVPVLLVYKTDKIFTEESCLMDFDNNISTYENGEVMIEPLNDVKRIGNLIEGFL